MSSAISQCERSRIRTRELQYMYIRQSCIYPPCTTGKVTCNFYFESLLMSWKNLVDLKRWKNICVFLTLCRMKNIIMPASSPLDFVFNWMMEARHSSCEKAYVLFSCYCFEITNLCNVYRTCQLALCVLFQILDMCNFCWIFQMDEISKLEHAKESCKMWIQLLSSLQFFLCKSA